MLLGEEGTCFPWDDEGWDANEGSVHDKEPTTVDVDGEDNAGCF